MKGDKINAALELIINHVPESGIESPKIYKLAKRAGISGRTLERAKASAGVESKRDGIKRIWVMTDEQRANLSASIGDWLYLPVTYIESSAQTALGEANITEPVITTLYRAGYNQSEEPLDLSELRRIFLITQRIVFRGKYDYFAGHIPNAMEGSAAYGDAFVFCNRSNSEIAILQWQGDGYALFSKGSEYGKFPWPAYAGVAAAEIVLEDLQMLIEHPKLMMRLSGKSTAVYAL